MTPASPSLADPGRFETALPLSSVQESKTNPRRGFDAAALQELADSIRAKGLLQPIVVRPLNGGTSFELVCGARRFRAAKLAGLAALPASVRILSDQEVLEIQVIENLQRQDLHPLEEAEGYRQLHETHGYTVDELAGKVGKSKAYVYGRLKFSALPQGARKLFLAGQLNPSTALLVARIPDAKLQEQAAKEIATGGGYGYMNDRQPLSFRQAAQHVQERYMLRLSDAPWKLGDAGLLPEAGPCTTCPKRTGNQPELFSDVKSADVCTDQACFDRKRQAHRDCVLQEARAAGREVLTGDEAKKLFERYDGKTLRGQAAFVEASGRCDADPKWKPGRSTPRSWKKLLGDRAPAAVVAVDAHGGVHELLPKSEAVAALEAAGVKVNPVDQAGGRRQAREDADEKRRRREGLIASRVEERAVAAIVEKAKKGDLTAPPLKLVARAFVNEMWHERHKDICAARGLEPVKQSYGKSYAKALHRLIDGLTLIELQGLLVELAARSSRDIGNASGVKPLASLYKVDLKAIEKQVRADLAEKPAKAKAAAARKAGR